MKLTDVENLLRSFQGVTFAGMDTTTKQRLLGGRKNPMVGRVNKVCRGHRVMLYTNQNTNGYENMVRRRLEAEGKDIEWNVASLPWGKRIPNTPIIVHNDKHYLQVIFLACGEVGYQLDGMPIMKEMIQGMPIEDMSSGRQGLEDENKVILRTFALDSIDAIRMMKEEVKS